MTDLDAAAAVINGTPRDAMVLLVCHVNPDGDALGSMLAFGLGLRRLGFTAVQATFPEPFDVAEPFQFLPGLDQLVAPADATATAATSVAPLLRNETAHLPGSSGLTRHATSASAAVRTTSMKLSSTCTGCPYRCRSSIVA